MLAIAVAASVTDLRGHLIPNRLLLRGLVAGFAVHLLNCLTTIVLASLQEQPLPWNVLLDAGIAVSINTAMGVVVALALYFFRLWSAGDAKLAMVVAAVQPAWLLTGGPVPWAPIITLLGNAIAVALVFLSCEVLLRGTPRLVRAIVVAKGEKRWPITWASVGATSRVAVAIVALATAFSPLRQWIGVHAGAANSGGPFFLFLLLFLLYKPLHRVTRTNLGLAAAFVVLVAGVTWSIWQRGGEGGLEVLRSLGIALAVMLGRAVLAASSRSFDSRQVEPKGLRPGMILTDACVDRLESDKRYQEAFLPHLGDMRGFRLDDNYIDNLKEWQSHNAPEFSFGVRSPLPFAPALAVAVVATCLLGRLWFTW